MSHTLILAEYIQQNKNTPLPNEWNVWNRHLKNEIAKQYKNNTNEKKRKEKPEKEKIHVSTI